MDFFSATQLLGYIAYAVSMTGAFQKNDKKLFLLFAASNALFSIHHFLLGNISACLSKIIVGSRMYLNIHFKGAVIAYPFAAIALISGYFSYKTPYSLLPVAAVVLATFVAAYSGGIKLRICFIFCCCLWLIHDIAGRSVGGAVEDITSILIYSFTLWRMKKDQKKSLNDSGSSVKLQQDRAA
ncbi:MAG: YgjV family protein [Alphaproteobacteria bacterium]|nr:YgjV family protein [Alphaproteobacteria bacterium]